MVKRKTFEWSQLVARYTATSQVVGMMLKKKVLVSQFPGQEVTVEAAVRNFVNQIGQRLTADERAAMLQKVGLGPQPSKELLEAAPGHDPTLNVKPPQKATKPKPLATPEAKKKRKKKRKRTSTVER